MSIGYIALVILGLVVAGSLMYGASALVKYFDRGANTHSGDK